jgi:hypothetical protein
MTSRRPNLLNHPEFLCPPRLSRLPAPPLPGPRASRGASRRPGPGVSACPACPDFVGEFLGALDSSSLGLILNLQLSTFNRVSFPPHLCALCGENPSSFRSLTPRHSALTANSFTIRTSGIPLPQPLYNPHLQAPLGSAGNKGLITPLESALTKNSPVSRLESALAKKDRGEEPVTVNRARLPLSSSGIDGSNSYRPSDCRPRF